MVKSPKPLRNSVKIEAYVDPATYGMLLQAAKDNKYRSVSMLVRTLLNQGLQNPDGYKRVALSIVESQH